MTSLASERYLFRWLSDHSGFRHVFFFVSRIFFWMGFCVYIIQFHGLNMVGIFSTNDVLENSGVVYLEPPGCQSPPGLHFQYGIHIYLLLGGGHTYWLTNLLGFNQQPAVLFRVVL